MNLKWWRKRLLEAYEAYERETEGGERVKRSILVEFDTDDDRYQQLLKKIKTATGGNMGYIDAIHLALQKLFEDEKLEIIYVRERCI